MGSYIKIDRKILEWEWWPDINTHRLFCYMLLKANWKDAKFKGEVIPRGSFVSSIAALAEGTNLTVNEVRTALKHLKSTNEITSKSCNKYTIFTVNNYDIYQDINEQNHKQITNKSQSINKPLTTIEEYKEIKKDRKEQESETASQRILPGERFNEFCQLYPKKVNNLLAVNGEYTYLLQTTSALSEDSLIAATRNYAESCRIQKKKEQYIKNPDNWLRDSSWINYLPENYKKPEEKKQNKFNQFQQNDYDFEQLEKDLLGNGGANGESEI